MITKRNTYESVEDWREEDGQEITESDVEGAVGGALTGAYYGGAAGAAGGAALTGLTASAGKAVTESWD